MTEAGETWASQVVGLHAIDVEQVLRAFVFEVKNRACGEFSTEYREESIGWAFIRLSRDLLGLSSELLGDPEK
jgi:hypothetical protein